MTSGRALRVSGALIAVAGLGIAILGLRAATMSTHTPQDPGSRMELVVRSELHGSEPGQTLAEHTRAKIHLCRMEVGHSDLVSDLQAVDDGLFRTVLQPALDDTNRKQLRGCLHDWNVDHLRVEVLSMQDLSMPS